MKKILTMAFTTLLLLMTMCSQPPKQVETAQPLVNESTEEPTYSEDYYPELKETPNSKEDEAYYIRKEAMIKDIIAVWDLFFEDGNANPDDDRRINFRTYAEYVAKWVIRCQDKDVTLNIEGKEITLPNRLPKHRSTHIMIATLITKESSVRANVIGAAPRFEVGLMQVWSTALQGYRREEVKKNPELGVMLGVEWVALSISQCESRHVWDKDWNINDWKKPITIYGSKPTKVWIDPKKKTCRIFKHGKERTKLVSNYIARINKT